VPIKRGKLHGKDIIILEELPNAIVWIEEEKLFKKCEEIFSDVAENPDHKLRGKTFLQAIMEDKDDKLGWGKYKKGLKELGYDVSERM